MSNYMRNLKVTFKDGDITMIPHRKILSMELRGGDATIIHEGGTVKFTCSASVFNDLCTLHETWSTECGELFKSGNFFPHALQALNKSIDFQMGEGLDRVVGRLDDISTQLSDRSKALCDIADNYTRLLSKG